MRLAAPVLFFLAGMLFPAAAQTVEVVKFDAIAQMLEARDDTVRVLNFWATWCKPCVEELPEFDSLTTHYAGEKVTIVLISLDFIKDLPKVSAFVKRRGIKPAVKLLDGGNPNIWIDRVSADWSGALPATVIADGRRGERRLLERQITAEEIKKIISESQPE